MIKAWSNAVRGTRGHVRAVLARGRDELECRLMLVLKWGVCGIEALLVLDCFLFPSRNSGRCDANLRAAL